MNLKNKLLLYVNHSVRKLYYCQSEAIRLSIDLKLTNESFRYIFEGSGDSDA